MDNIEDIRTYCLSKPMTTESFPFGDDTLVFKVSGKIFALAGLDEELRINLKCDPELAVELREKYDAVLPGYHMNKRHWNTVIVEQINDYRLLESWIDHSYEKVAEKLPLSVRKKLL